jgi:hypothetical protein
MGKIRGEDKDGVKWTGNVTGKTIEWISDHGHRGTEEVTRNSDGTMSGGKTTGDVVPCKYDGENWTGDCPPGTYKEED